VACCILLIGYPDASSATQPGALDDEPGMWRVVAHRETKVRRQHGSAEVIVGYDPSSWEGKAIGFLSP
jgi:hypothetical protein